MTGVAKKKSDSKTKKPEVMEQIHDAEEYPIEEDKDLMNASYTICASLHGGNDQYDRDRTVTIFKQGKVQTLVATSVVARELFCQTTMRTSSQGGVAQAGPATRGSATPSTTEQDWYRREIMNALS